MHFWLLVSATSFILHEAPEMAAYVLLLYISISTMTQSFYIHEGLHLQ